MILQLTLFSTVGDYNRGSERASYQSYQNIPVEKHGYNKKSNVSKQKSSQRHLISRENLMARNDAMSSTNAQYFGYLNNKSEDELSSVSVGRLLCFLYYDELVITDSCLCKHTLMNLYIFRERYHAI